MSNGRGRRCCTGICCICGRMKCVKFADAQDHCFFAFVSVIGHFFSASSTL